MSEIKIAEIGAEPTPQELFESVHRLHKEGRLSKRDYDEFIINVQSYNSHANSYKDGTGTHFAASSAKGLLVETANRLIQRAEQAPAPVGGTSAPPPASPASPSPAPAPKPQPAAPAASPAPANDEPAWLGKFVTSRIDPIEQGLTYAHQRLDGHEQRLTVAEAKIATLEKRGGGAASQFNMKAGGISAAIALTLVIVVLVIAGQSSGYAFAIASIAALVFGAIIGAIRAGKSQKSN